MAEKSERGTETSKHRNGSGLPSNGQKNETLPTEILKEAIPPWHTVAIIFGLIAYFVAMIPIRWSTMDDIANKESFLHVNFPKLLSIRQVAFARLLFGSVMIIDSLYALLFGSWEQDTEYYYPYSRLKVARGLQFRGYMYSGSIVSGLLTLSSFTMWSWTLEGITFILLGVISVHLESDPDKDLPAWIYRIAMVMWEICAPTSILVSAIVKYVLWPMALEQGENNANLLKHPGALLEHNWNVLSCLIEVALLGGLPVRYQDFIWAPLFGLVYLLYSYAMMHSWAPAEYGPQFIYPFFDTTMEWLTSVCLLALLSVLALSFGIFAALDHFITETLREDDLWSHVAAVVAIGLMVCRFRD